MNVLVDMCMIPIGEGVSLSPYVSACVRHLNETGLKTNIHAFGTNIEGEWDTVFPAIRRCVELVHSMGANRILINLTVSTRTDRDQGIEEKILAVTAKMHPISSERSPANCKRDSAKS